MVDGNAPAQDGTAGMREDPVASVERADGSIVVSLAGELDLYNAEEIKSAVREAGARKPDRLVIDLAEVGFVDSTVLAVLIDARRRQLGHGTFHLAAPSREVRRALGVSGLDRHLAVHDTIEDALTSSP